jgi:hypothetical protein
MSSGSNMKIPISASLVMLKAGIYIVNVGGYIYTAIPIRILRKPQE